MNKSLLSLICLSAVACSTKNPTESFVGSYSLTDEAMVQLIGDYQSDSASNETLSICEIKTSSENHVLYIEHKEHGDTVQRALVLGQPSIDHTGYSSIFVTEHEIKNPSSVLGLCGTERTEEIALKNFVTSNCSAQLRWNGLGFDGFWGDNCGTFSNELIQVNSGEMAVFSSHWNDKSGDATADNF